METGFEPGGVYNEVSVEGNKKKKKKRKIKQPLWSLMMKACLTSQIGYIKWRMAGWLKMNVFPNTNQADEG